MFTSSPHVVFVHGGWTDASIWTGVLNLVSAQSIRVSAVQLALASFQEDVISLESHLAFHDQNNYLLVGHSYGGAVITEAAKDPRVRGLVYLAASAPIADETFGEFMQRHPSRFPLELVPGISGSLWGQQSFFVEALAHDLPHDEALRLFRLQNPVNAAIMAGSVKHEGWKHLPTWYAIATEDRIADPDVQRNLASQMNASIRIQNAGHMLPLNSPEFVAQLVLDAVREVEKGTLPGI